MGSLSVAMDEAVREVLCKATLALGDSAASDGLLKTQDISVTDTKRG